jgi:hypothetical protein
MAASPSIEQTSRETTRIKRYNGRLNYQSIGIA